MAETLRALDPPDCGCTDCLTGRSRPFDAATPDEVQAVFRGELEDRTGGCLPSWVGVLRKDMVWAMRAHMGPHFVDYYYEDLAAPFLAVAFAAVRAATEEAPR